MKKLHLLIALCVLLCLLIALYTFYFKKPDTSKYIGVEIGASGSKCAVFTIKNQKYSIDTMFSDDRGTLFKNPNQTDVIGSQNIEVLINSVKNIFATTLHHEIPNENKYIVIGSFFNDANDKTVLEEELKKSFKGYNIEQLNSVQEGSANFKTITASKNFPFNGSDILVVDIGSGQIALSTVGNGVFTRTLTLGTKTFAHQIDPNNTMKDDEFQKKVLERIDSYVLRMINQNIDFTTKSKIIITGGIAYRICCENTLLTTNLPNIPHSMVVDFKSKVRANRLTCSKPSYSHKQLLCGAIILETIQKKIGINKSYYDFDRHTWIPGYVIDKLNY